MRALALCLFLAPLMALGQVFYSDETFYGYLEHKARLAAFEEERARSALEQAQAERQTAREREHQRVMEAARDALDAYTLEAIKWLEENR